MPKYFPAKEFPYMDNNNIFVVNHCYIFIVIIL